MSSNIDDMVREVVDKSNAMEALQGTDKGVVILHLGDGEYGVRVFNLTNAELAFAIMSANALFHMYVLEDDNE